MDNVGGSQMDTTERYSRNMMMLTPEENDSLKNKVVAVIGCGGLGGGIIEMLGRMGIGHIIAVDGDVFEASNLNRQVLSHT
jgi:molybdopterin-synthase adenylyltransferase